jgi:hypothetical protein
MAGPRPPDASRRQRIAPKSGCRLSAIAMRNQKRRTVSAILESRSPL